MGRCDGPFNPSLWLVTGLLSAVRENHGSALVHGNYVPFELGNFHAIRLPAVDGCGGSHGAGQGGG